MRNSNVGLEIRRFRGEGGRILFRFLKVEGVRFILDGFKGWWFWFYLVCVWFIVGFFDNDG